MSLPPFLLLLTLLFIHAHCLTPTLRIAFTDSTPPPQFTSFNASRITPGTKIQSSTKHIPLPFRRRASNPAGFAYTIPLIPGVYKLTFGLLEFTNAACYTGQRVFSLSANDLSFGKIDVFQRVGCHRQLSVHFPNVRATKPFIKIFATPISGRPPFLSNLLITPVRTLSYTTPRIPLSSPANQSASSRIALALDVAGRTDMPQYIIGNTSTYPNVFPIIGTGNDAKFSKHRFGTLFSYLIPVPSNIVYDVQLFFAESYLPACTPNFRVFDVAVHDANRPISTGASVKGLDVFQRAGCRTQYTLKFQDIVVRNSGRIAIYFKSSKNNAMISAFTISTRDPNFVRTPAQSVRPATLPTLTEAQYNVGGGSDMYALGSRKVYSKLDVMATGFAPPTFYNSARIGSDFTFSLNVAPGAYDITIGFVEFAQGFCDEDGKRVFNVYINDEIQLEGYDIFASVGCNTADEKTFEGQTVGAVYVKPLTIRFSSIVSFAVVSYIRVRKSRDECDPLTMQGDITADHAAHAVPGSYPPQLSHTSPRSYVDGDGDGFMRVTINGDRSHTHFFDSVNNIPGKITDYTWSLVESGKVISRRESFSYNFPLGTTRLKLAVVDSACTRDEAETSVTVVGAIRPGQYCYYYKDMSEIPKGGTLMQHPVPSFAKIRRVGYFGFPRLPFPDDSFAVRCQFFLQTDRALKRSVISVSTRGSGIARVYKGADLILDSTSSPRANTTLPVGLTAFEVVYLRTPTTRIPKLIFRVNGVIPPARFISHDRSTIRPIITDLDPKEGQLRGGVRVKVTGYGLYQPMTVSFGGKIVDVIQSGLSDRQFFVEAPPSNSTAPVKIFATTTRGLRTNSVMYSYASECDSIKFTETRILTRRGYPVDYLELPTCASIGQDGKIYLGTLGGTVQVLGYSAETLTSTSHCYSKPVVDMNFMANNTPSVRDILGITFDPSERVIMPYISTNTLFWRERETIELNNTAAWRNGAVDRMKPGKDPSDGKICLVYDKRIVSGLPVSNHDHGVEALVFAQNGDLLISVGGLTNMGLPGYKLGGLWEAGLSAAVLVAKLSKPDFDGNITYSNPDVPRHAKQISGDVHIYASGVRNAFAMTMASSGNVYATDQGPNCGFGDTASSCHDYNEANASRWDVNGEVDWKGKVRHGWETCPYSIGRPDKVLRLSKGTWYGHPNIQRGGNECAWIDPYDGRTADDKKAPDTYRRAMALLKSPVTGIREYRSNHFCGRLRGELILSSYNFGSTYRMRVQGGKRLSGPDEILGHGGITFVENAHGMLIFPRLQRKSVFVMKPRSSARPSLFVTGAVPFRHGHEGGTRIVVGGKNFGPLPAVWIDGKACEVIRSSDTEIMCRVPEGSGLKDLKVTTADGSSEILTDAVLYMDA